MEEEILVSKFISRLLCCWLLFGKCLLLPLHYYFRHRLSKWFLFCRLVLENKIITKLSESLSKLHSLTTISRWETELDVQGGQATTGCFTWELYLVISKLSLFPESSSFQSLPHTLVVSDQDARLPHKTDSSPSPALQGCGERELSTVKSHLIFLTEGVRDLDITGWQEHWNPQGDSQMGSFNSLAGKFITALEIIWKSVREKWSNKLYILYYGTLYSYYKECAKSS